MSQKLSETTKFWCQQMGFFGPYGPTLFGFGIDTSKLTRAYKIANFRNNCVIPLMNMIYGLNHRCYQPNFIPSTLTRPSSRSSFEPIKWYVCKKNFQFGLLWIILYSLNSKNRAINTSDDDDVFSKKTHQIKVIKREVVTEISSFISRHIFAKLAEFYFHTYAFFLWK